jgi:hypothetical protein
MSCCGFRIRPVPRQNLDGVAAHRPDLADAPIVDHARFAAARGFLNAMLFESHDQAAPRRQQVNRRGHGKIRIEQHRTAMRRQCLHQQTLGRGDIGIDHLVLRYLARLRDRLEHRRALVERHHAEVSIGVGQAREPSCLSNRTHRLFLWNARQS